MTTAYHPISLGSACEAKFQICRNLYYSFYGGKREDGFRIHIMPEDCSQAYYGWHTFDWQRTRFPLTMHSPVGLRWVGKTAPPVAPPEALRRPLFARLLGR